MGKPIQRPRELLGLKNEDIITSSSTGRASTMAIVVHHIELGPSQGPILQELVNFSIWKHCALTNHTRGEAATEENGGIKLNS